MIHHCKYFLIRCIDFRLGKPIKEYQEREGIMGNCDEPGAAGGVKDADFVLRQLDISVRLHNPQEVILINHTDCGAYGGSKVFGSLEEEYKFHVEELKKAKEMILAKYPSLKVKMLLAKIQPSGEVEFEEINA